jgi:lipopolysaccharide export system protein LptA
MIILRLILIVLTIFCTAKTTFAAQESGVGNIITTKITANFIDIKRKSEMVNLIGNVIVEKEDLSIKADNMVVYYYENKGDQDDQGGKIKKIEASSGLFLTVPAFEVGDHVIWGATAMMLREIGELIKTLKV